MVLNFISHIFDAIYQLLKWIASITGLTYKEVNIVIYYIVIPALFLYLISRITKQKWYVISFLILISIALLFIPDFEQFSSNLFDRSVAFLNWFEIIGLNYIQASVVVCVFVPVLILILFFYISAKRKYKRQ